METKFYVFTLEEMSGGGRCVFVSEHFDLEWAIAQIDLEQRQWITIPPELKGINTVVNSWGTLGSVAIVLYERAKRVAELIIGENPELFKSSISRVTKQNWEWGKVIPV